MNLLIFRTDIKTKRSVEKIGPIFNGHPTISGWSIDRDDIDNVLRVETKEGISEGEIINWIKRKGFFCEVLNY